MHDGMLRTALKARPVRILLAVLCALLVLLPGARAADDTELKRLQNLLSVINQELQASYQQYQMASEARRYALQTQLNDYLAPAEIQQYEDFQRRQRDAARRDRELAEQMDRILARVRELEDQKKPVLDRIYEILRERAAQPPEATQETPSARPTPSSEPARPAQPSPRSTAPAPAGGY